MAALQPLATPESNRDGRFQGPESLRRGPFGFSLVLLRKSPRPPLALARREHPLRVARRRRRRSASSPSSSSSSARGAGSGGRGGERTLTLAVQGAAAAAAAARRAWASGLGRLVVAGDGSARVADRSSWRCGAASSPSDRARG
eukprot:scaffold2090_cov225-Prasinococcus_capsulatus_cf.AAC.11